MGPRGHCCRPGGRKKVLKSSRWQNVINAFDKKLPFAPEDRSLWTDDQFGLEVLKEVAIGNLRELTPEEIHANEISTKLEDRIKSGDEDWLERTLEEMHSQGFDDFGEDEALIDLMNEAL